MANPNTPQGFSLFRAGGKAEPARQRRRVAAARASNFVIAVGDAYTILADGTADRAPADVDIHGVVEGIEFQEKDTGGPESLDIIPDDVGAYIIGIEDKDAIFEVQSDATGFAETNVDGTGATLVAAAPSTLLRRSTHSVTAGGGNTEFKVIGLSPRVGNESGAYTKVLVKLTNVL